MWKIFVSWVRDTPDTWWECQLIALAFMAPVFCFNVGRGLSNFERASTKSKEHMLAKLDEYGLDRALKSFVPRLVLGNFLFAFVEEFIFRLPLAFAFVYSDLVAGIAVFISGAAFIMLHRVVLHKGMSFKELLICYLPVTIALTILFAKFGGIHGEKWWPTLMVSLPHALYNGGFEIVIHLTLWFRYLRKKS